MEVSYNIRPRDFLQAHIYRFNSSLVGKASYFAWLMFPLLPYASHWLLGLNPAKAAPIGATIGWIIGSAAPFIIFSLSTSITTVTMDTHGFMIATESISRKSLTAWRSVKAVEEDGLYIYFRQAWQAVVIPKDAFANSEEAKTFFSEALFYWRETKGIAPPSDPDTSGVWPPAPRTGDSQGTGETPKH